ncbi:MAG: hypothetical protein F2851_04660 [Actinobacteria bacterium]|uniref:Unannotated protein n=1 Tax=freshwater metagenome TaxID=449393 RepID=A0A6J5ZCS2_9ZZZZ|nr:hypothetical protein [Actinomycetota bacterium]
MKKLLTGIVLLGFLFSFSPIASGDAPEENFYPSVKQEAGWMGYNSDNSIEYAQPSSLIGMTNFPKGDFIEKIYICDSLEATDCKRPEIKVLTFASVFTKCLNDTDTDCIDSFSIKNEDGSVISAKFQRNWVPAPVFKGDKSKFLPTGYGPSSWTLTNDEGKLETYALSVGVNGNLDLSRNPNKSNFESFFAAVQPIKEILGTEYEGPVVNVTKRGVGESRGWNTKFIEKGCQIAEKGLCGYRMPFDLEKTIVLKVRLSQPVQGWLHGRMKDADIAMKTAADNSQVVEISAKPLSVPSIYGWAKWGELPQKLKDLYPVGAGGTTRDFGDFTTTDLSSRTLLTMSMVSGDAAINEMNLWLPLLNDKAAAMRTFWVAQTIRGELPFDSQNCVRGKGFTGVIGTNAAVYSDGPPRFDQAEQSLNYTVGASHLDTKGDLFKGYYQLNLRSDVARCLYGFGSAPIQAKIEVSSSDGTPSVATTVITEKDSWLKMTAAGFTFSTPKIKVKLSQEAEATPAASPTPLIEKTTISCVKGKASKKVTALKPKCPTGFKKK